LVFLSWLFSSDTQTRTLLSRVSEPNNHHSIVARAAPASHEKCACAVLLQTAAAAGVPPAGAVIFPQSGVAAHFLLSGGMLLDNSSWLHDKVLGEPTRCCSDPSVCAGSSVLRALGSMGHCCCLSVCSCLSLLRRVSSEYANRDAIMEAKKARTGSYH
jgi:hypothetical protein